MTTTTTSKPQSVKSAPATAKVAQAPAKTVKRERVNVDVAALSFAADEAPVRQSAGRKATWTPAKHVLDAISASWDGRKVLREYKDSNGTARFTYIGTGRAVTVPTDQASATETLLRKHATYLKLGLAVKREELPGGNTKIRFAAKSPKQTKA